MQVGPPHRRLGGLAAVTVVPTVALVAQACDGATYRWRVLREASR